MSKGLDMRLARPYCLSTRDGEEKILHLPDEEYECAGITQVFGCKYESGFSSRQGYGFFYLSPHPNQLRGHLPSYLTGSPAPFSENKAAEA
jgi:hypothetical protein